MNRSTFLLRLLLRKSSSLCKPSVPIPAPKPSGNLNSIKEPKPSKGSKDDGGKGGGDPLKRTSIASSWLFWKRMSLFVAFPIVAVCMLNVILFHKKLKRPTFIKFEYLRIRNKRFPWGDGQRTLFHNPRVNALPDGYETEIPEEDYAKDHKISDDVQEGEGDGNKLADSTRKDSVPRIRSLKDQIMEGVKEGTKEGTEAVKEGTESIKEGTEAVKEGTEAIKELAKDGADVVRDALKK